MSGEDRELRIGSHLEESSIGEEGTPGVGQFVARDALDGEAGKGGADGSCGLCRIRCGFAGAAGGVDNFAGDCAEEPFGAREKFEAQAAFGTT